MLERVILFECLAACSMQAEASMFFFSFPRLIFAWESPTWKTLSNPQTHTVIRPNEMLMEGLVMIEPPK